jgi:hypothetical protein
MTQVYRRICAARSGPVGVPTAIVVAARSAAALSERLALLQTVAPDAVVLVSDDATALRRQLPRRGATYLLDANGVTARVAAYLAARRRPYVLDTGDDVRSLARRLRGRRAEVAAAAAETALLGGASGLVHRGVFHRPLLVGRTTGPLHWAPDTVPDAVIDGPIDGSDPHLVASFGSARRPGEGDAAYGWEVIDLVAASPHLRGLLVVRGDGRTSLEKRAARLGVSERIRIEDPVPLDGLVELLRAATYVTSMQTDDRAGWVRTTGKLPIALACGKVLLSTAVGEAWRVLPPRFLAAEPSDPIAGFSRAVAGGVPAGWPVEAKLLAETYRRSSVADGLRSYLVAAA